MVMTGDSSVFVDTNILVYASIPETPLHSVALDVVQTLERTGKALWVSRQILREYVATLTRPQTFGGSIPVALVVEEVSQFESRFRVAEDNAQVTASLLALIQQVLVGGKQVHDANIVATMQAYGIEQLLTHNTIDFERFAALITVLPLVDTQA